MGTVLARKTSPESPGPRSWEYEVVHFCPFSNLCLPPGPQPTVRPRSRGMLHRPHRAWAVRALAQRVDMRAWPRVMFALQGAGEAESTSRSCHEYGF